MSIRKIKILINKQAGNKGYNEQDRDKTDTGHREAE